MYLDDILIASKTFDEHNIIRNISEVFARLRAAGLRLSQRNVSFSDKWYPTWGT